MSPTSKLRVYGALISAMAIWGLSFLAIKDVIGTIPIFSLLFARFLLATLLLGILAITRKALRLPRRDLLTLAGLSILSPVGYFLFETYGVFHTCAYTRGQALPTNLLPGIHCNPVSLK